MIWNRATSFPLVHICWRSVLHWPAIGRALRFIPSGSAASLIRPDWFSGAAGPALLISLIDMGGRFRLILHEVEAVQPIYAMPNLPVARVMWKPKPDLMTGAHAWILAGGAHHSVMSFAATPEMLKDWAEIMGIEVVHINHETTIDGLKKDLFLADLAWKLR